MHFEHHCIGIFQFKLLISGFIRFGWTSLKLDIVLCPCSEFIVFKSHVSRKSTIYHSDSVIKCSDVQNICIQTLYIQILFIALSMVRGLLTQFTEPNRTGSTLTLVVNHASSLITFTFSPCRRAQFEHHHHQEKTFCVGWYVAYVVNKGRCWTEETQLWSPPVGM